ncbi:MAG TPA: wax ester/triacylglycerol synthase domain-containing protein, partial [Pseudonocardiaceae bacterium]|nr:wax ester/triacylglycerol synthase domain-containing protein [Pseudonocardiaceae bacterium]
MTAPVEGARPPKRLLVVSATIGEGHNATARAVEERAQRLWPGIEIRRVDTLEEMGPWVGPGFRWIYRVNVDTTPWLYDYFYRSLWRHPWFATASRRFVGTWSGRRLGPVIASYQPDLVVSTYPLGTAGLDWMRRRGGLDVPVAAIVSDFAPHPFWVYPEVDLHYVASQASLRAMRQAQPDARGAVGAPPVVAAFAPADKIAARQRCGLPEDRLVVLVSCGSLGFGSIERAVGAALAAGPEICVVVACGRNEALRARLAARAGPAERLVPPRLIPLGWTTEMPALTIAADAVITNAGGATALEALACGRAVLMFEPIAGHGKANAELMARAGLASLCQGPAELAAAIRALPAQQALAERAALAHIGALDLDAELAALPGLPRHRGARPLTASDAFFAHAATAAVPQQVGAVLLLEGVLDEAALTARITGRVADLPMLRRRLEPRRGRWPRWLPAGDIDPAAHLSTRTVSTTRGVPFPVAVREFLATPVPLDRPPWQLQLLHDTDTSRSALLAKLHHTLGDGLAVTATLLALLTDQRAEPCSSHRSAGPRPSRAGRVTRMAGVAQAGRVVRVVRGLASLAAAGPAPGRGPVRVSTPGREYALAVLPAAAVRARAREHGVSTTALLLALTGEALHRVDPALATRHGRIRAMVPWTIHALRRADPGGERYQGNHTAAIALDLPVGPMPLPWRMAEVAAALA